MRAVCLASARNQVPVPFRPALKAHLHPFRRAVKAPAPVPLPSRPAANQARRPRRPAARAVQALQNLRRRPP